MTRFASILLSAIVITSAMAADVTPAQWLALQPKPQLKPGHRLPHLTKFSWPYSYELTVEMAEHWGYTLELGEANPTELASLSNTNSRLARLVTLATNNPGKFATSVSLWRTIDAFTNRPPGFYCTNATGLFVDATGTNFFSGSEFPKVISPEGPDDYWAAVSAHQAGPIRTLKELVPIAIVINGGEYGMDVPGFGAKAWQHDPRVQAATNGLAWPRYASNRKAAQLGHITREIYELLPQRELYLFYSTHMEQNRFNVSGYNWERDYANWGWFSDVMNTNTDWPAFESYYQALNNWTNAADVQWSNVSDLLTKHLNGVAFNFTLGYSNNYSFVSGGWAITSSNRLSEIPRYLGFLKCLYTSGMIGGVAGYFEFPTGTTPSIFGHNGFTGSFPPDFPPHWLLQIEALARVHAQFSHLDDWLFNARLISGPQKHFMSRDQPAYEFTNTLADANCRVLARKHNERAEWLICAWAAHGDARNVTVDIPNLGNVTVTARDSGSLYLATDANNPMLLDEQGRHVFRKEGHAESMFVR